MTIDEKVNAVKIMHCFVEGRISTEEFWKCYKINEHIRNIIINDKMRPNESICFFDGEKLLERIDINKLEHKSGLFTAVLKYFLRNGINIKSYNKDAELFSFLLEIQPEWLDVQDEKLLLDIINSAPDGISKTKKKLWCKNKILELFKYDKKPPRWIQSPEWPLNKNGKPLIFRNQTRENKESELVKYYFYDPETNEEVIIEQLY